MTNTSLRPLKPEDDSGLWSVHSEYDHRPTICAWMRSETEATQKMAELKADDPNAGETEYWILPLSNRQVEGFKATGFIPKDVQ